MDGVLTAIVESFVESSEIFENERIYEYVNTYILELSLMFLIIGGPTCLRLNQSYKLKMS